MTVHEQRILLQEKGLVPELYDLGDEISKVGISDFNRLSGNEKSLVRDSVAVVLDDAIWAASDEPIAGSVIPETASIFSGNGVLVGKHIRRKNFGKYKVDMDGGLMTTSYEHLYTNKKEDILMENEGMKSLGDLSIEDLAKDLGGAAENSAPQPMQSFSGDGAQQTEKKSHPTLSKAITDALQDQDIANPRPLQMFNKAFGSLIGYVTNNEEYISASTKFVDIVRDGKKVLIPNVPDYVREEFARTGKVKSEFLQKETHLVMRQVKPGKIRGLVLTIPEGGHVSLTRFREPGEIHADESKKDLKYLLLTGDVYPSFLDFFYGRGIKENKATHGEEAGEVIQVNRTSYRTKNRAKSPSNLISRVLKNPARKSLIISTNYFPLKTYEKFELKARLTEEEIDLLNESTFRSLVSSTPGRGQTASRFELLNAEDKMNVYVEDGKIKSRFFTNDEMNRVAIDVPTFYNNKERVNKIEIPIKYRPVLKDQTLGRPKYRTYDTTDEETLNNPETREKTSLFSGKYQHFIEAANGAISLESLRDLTRRSGKRGKGKAAGLDNETVLKMQMGLAGKIFSDTQLQFSERPDGDYYAVIDKLNALHMGVEV